MRLGWVFGGRLILVERTGRRTARDIALRLRLSIVTGRGLSPAFGRRADWYRDLVAAPDTRVVLRWRATPAIARPIPETEGSLLMLRYALHHRRLARWILALLGYEIDGTDEDFLEVAACVSCA